MEIMKVGESRHGNGVCQAEAVRVIAADGQRVGHPEAVVGIHVARGGINARLRQSLQGIFQPSAFGVVDAKAVDGVQQDAPVACLQQLHAVFVHQVRGDMAESVLVGVDGQPVDAGHPQLSARVAQQCPDLVVLRTQRIIGAVILLVFVGVIFVQSAEGAYPDVALRVFGKGVDLLVGQLVGKEGILYIPGVCFLAPGSTGARGKKHGQRYRQAKAKKEVFHVVCSSVTGAKLNEKADKKAVIRHILNKKAIL